ncbi:MAG: Hpt domain-containing protein [Victivallales bacterium]|nr:Hpt domain-containing protein [Victivallales bacterium]
MKQLCIDFLMEQFGDEETVKEIYDEYAKSIVEKIGEADTTLASEQWTELDHVAHAIKGNALATGDNAVAETAIELRLAAKLQDKDKSLALVNKIKELAKDI